MGEGEPHIIAGGLRGPQGDASRAGLAVRLLGGITVSGPAGAANLVGARQRTIVAALAIRVGAVVPRTRLVDALWEDPPATADKTLNSHIARLRQALAACGRPDALVTRAPGYVLRLEPAEVDAHRFEDLVRRARSTAATDLAAAARQLRESLALWDGAALADAEPVDWLAAEVARLDELRLAATEDRWAFELAAEGVTTGGLAELEYLTAAHPFRERLWELLMVALYRSGRQGDALAAYLRAREVLAEHLGIEPGGRLRRQHAAILAGGDSEPLLDQPAPAAPAPPQVAPAASEPVAALPEPFTAIVGRDNAVADVHAALATRRLVTLVGPAGCGKTRLAIEAARGGDPRFVDLTVVDQPERLADTVAAALALTDDGTTDAFERLVRHLRGDAPPLLVLDNCEHVIAQCAALLARLLPACPRLRVLATSRQPLRLSGEAVRRVAPLPPDDAARLFVDLVRDHTGVPVPADELPLVDDLCRDLDGLPLAIELAAARSTALSVRDIAARLSDRFALLRTSRDARDPGARHHHHTLAAALDWSYDLIDERQRALLRRLTVFVGGWRLDAAEAVDPDALDLLTELVDRSLVVVDRRDATTRYRLLETVRAYALRRMSTDERMLAQRRHATHFLALGEEAARNLRGGHQATWLGRLAADFPNLQAAMHWLLEHGDGTEDLRLATALAAYSKYSGHYREGRRWLDLALRRRPDAPDEVRLPAVIEASGLAILDCEYPTAVRLAHEALDLTGPDRPEFARLLVLLASVQRETGQYDQAIACVERALVYYRVVGDENGIARALHTGAFASWVGGDLPAANRYLTECLPRVRAVGDPEAIASALLNLGASAFYSGDTERARRLFDDALERYQLINFDEGVAWVRNMLGLVELRGGRDGSARAHLVASLGLHRQLGDRWRTASVLEALAEALRRAGSGRTAAVLLGAAGAIRSAIGAPVPAVERTDWERTYGALQAELGESELLAAITEGHDRELDGVLAAVPDVVAVRLQGPDLPDIDPPEIGHNTPNLARST
jgi:predicted ATPase/DNA-binding SARP family transcriptional activator